MKKCGTCGTEDTFPEDIKSETRPYGPGGALICVRCAFATPEMEATVEANYRVLVDADETVYGAHIIGETSLG